MGKILGLFAVFILALALPAMASDYASTEHFDDEVSIYAETLAGADESLYVAAQPITYEDNCEMAQNPATDTGHYRTQEVTTACSGG